MMKIQEQKLKMLQLQQKIKLKNIILPLVVMYI